MKNLRTRLIKSVANKYEKKLNGFKSTFDGINEEITGDWQGRLSRSEIEAVAQELQIRGCLE